MLEKIIIRDGVVDILKLSIFIQVLIYYTTTYIGRKANLRVDTRWNRLQSQCSREDMRCWRL